MRLTRIIFWVLLTVVVAAVAFAVALMFIGWYGQQSVTEDMHELEYRWVNRYWVKGAEPADLARHRVWASVMLASAPPAKFDDFPVSGHRIVSGSGIVLSKRIFSVIPYRRYPHGSKERFSKLTIYLPGGLPVKGETVDFGADSPAAPFALLTTGWADFVSQACFGYASAGSVRALDTEPANVIQAAGAGGKTEESPPDQIPHNIRMDIRLEFETWEVTGKKRWACGRVAVDEIMVLRLRDASNLSVWDGKAVGPTTEAEVSRNVVRP